MDFDILLCVEQYLNDEILARVTSKKAHVSFLSKITCMPPGPCTPYKLYNPPLNVLSILHTYLDGSFAFKTANV